MTDSATGTGKSGVVWFHAASVGEFEQARPLIEKLRAENRQAKILLTFFSPSGYELRKNYAMVDKVVYLPFATGKNARRFLDIVKPEKVIFIKYEFWPAYLKELKKREIQTYLVSAIFRPKQLFFRWYGGLYKKLLTCFTRIFVQDTASIELLAKHKIARATEEGGYENCQVTGDTRFDRVTAVAKEAKEVPFVERFAYEQPKVLIAGSTWPKDEELLVKYVMNRPDVKLVLVPHEIHEGHLHEIFQLFLGQMVRYTQANTCNIVSTQTVVVDTIGYLSSIYRYGHVAYIGGGFGVGIHNTIEAAVYGMPVVFGPNYKNFREAKGLIAAGASRSVRNYAELEAALDEAFARRDEMGEAAKAYCQSELGATDAIYQAIFKK